MRIIGLGVALLSLFALAWLPEYPHVSACDPGRPNDFPANWVAGWVRQPGGNVGGVYALIENYNPYTYLGFPRSSSAWTMVHKAPELLWAQTGWIEYSATDRRTFAQVNNGGPYPINRYDPAGAQPYWQNTYYTTLYNNVPNYFSFQVNGYTWTQIRAFWVPHTGENAGEVTTKAHQFPGDSNNQQYSYDVHIWYSNAWRDFNGTQASDDWSEFYAFLENPRTLSVMDARCTYPN